MRNGTPVASIFFLQLAVALFFLSSGIVGIINYNSYGSELARAVGKLFGSTNSSLNLVIAILQVISGSLLAVGSFISFAGRSGFFAALTIFVLWAILIIFKHFTNDFLSPDILIWIYRLSPDLIILSALWMVAWRYA